MAEKNLAKLDWAPVFSVAQVRPQIQVDGAKIFMTDDRPPRVGDHTDRCSAPVVRRTWRTVAAGAVAGVAACGADRASTAPRTPASITVNVTMVGNSADSDGFAVRVGGAKLFFTGAGTQVASPLSRGPYPVELSGLLGNCATDNS